MAYSSYLVIALLALVAATHAAKPKLSEFLTPCRADDSNINECVRQVILKALPKLAKGVRELGLLPYDPLEVPRVIIDQRGMGGPVGIMLTFIKSQHLGISKFIPTTVKVIPEEMYFQLNCTLSSYKIIGDYEVSGRVLLLPLVGTGPSNLTINDLTYSWTFQGRPEMRNNKMYMRVAKSDMIMNIGSGSIRLENLFMGDMMLGDTMNTILNENFKDVIREILPALQDTFAELNKQIIDPLFASVPYQEIFPGVNLSKVKGVPADN